MIKLGIIYCSYGMPEYFEMSLNPWIKAKQRHNISIAAVHGQFSDFHEMDLLDVDTETVTKLYGVLSPSLVEYIYIQNDYFGDSSDNWLFQTEAQIRNYGLQYLLKANCDYVMLWDGDEKITDQEIDNLIQFLDNPDNQYIPFWKFEYKNLIGNENNFIKGFCPKRIWKVKYDYYHLHEVVGDNDMAYLDTLSSLKLTIRDDCFIVKEIPTTVINPLHYSWLNNKRSKDKIEYQLRRWGICSYKWNEQENKVEFNNDYYTTFNKQIPEILTIQS